MVSPVARPRLPPSISRLNRAGKQSTARRGSLQVLEQVVQVAVMRFYQLAQAHMQP